MTTPPQQPTDQPHVHQAPPQDDATVRTIVEILLAGYALHATAEGVAHILRLPVVPVLAALGLAGTGTAHRPNARLQETPGAKTEGVVKKVRDAETYYRAAYVVAAANRIAVSMKAGKTVKQAIEIERPNTRAHEQARRNRLNTAAKMQRLAKMFGPLLGWYRDPLSHSETECYEADGHNFNAIEGTIIGYPGSVHPKCRCVAGPPHAEGGMVNDHVHVRLTPTIKRTFKLKK